MALDADGVGNPSSSSASARTWKYHVFLSFRGEDTRTNFTDHMYDALQRKGIKTFRDDENLGRGQVIKPSLLQAIEESLSAIVVLSPNYASSTWCLDELLKILDSKKELGLQVFPIFYGVDPSDVRQQKGSFAEAFKKHEENSTQDKMTVQKWRDALQEVANLSGWHSENWHETKLIQIVIEKVWSKLYDELPFDREILVGIESKISELDLVVENGLGGVRAIGIWGTGGLGKTTLARAFYERMHTDYEVHCFLHNVREASEKNGLISLQRKLLSSLDKTSMYVGDLYEGRMLIKNMFCKRKILLVLDDASDISQLENLAGKQEWFGNGSRIIITTRDKHLLSSYHEYALYEVEFLSNDESRELFHQIAFNGKQPNVDYLELSRTVIQYGEGLPLALKVLGSFLRGRKISEWKDAIAKFKKVPPNDILKILRVSFDGLEDDEKTIFLDIACFFKGEDKDYVIQIFQNLDLHPIIGIGVLIDKALITMYDRTLWVHDMLQEMGKNIVLQESPNDPSKRSRIWSLEDANYVLETNKGTEAIQSIVLRLDKPYVSHWVPESFSKMSNLKLLIISGRDCHLNLHQGLRCLSNTLKVVEWEGCPLEALPIQVPLNELVDLKMQLSQLKQLWRGTLVLRRLKFIDLKNSRYLIKTPNFDEIPYLQKLILEGCTKLVEVHPSLERHQNLVIVDFKDCKSIKSLPKQFEMTCLEIFILSGCSKINQLPEFGKSMERLSELHLEETAIVQLPQSLVNLTSLRILNLSGCLKLSRLPDNLNQNVTLEELNASGTAIKEVPSSIIHLKNMKRLSFSRCTGQAQSSTWKFASHFGSLFRLIWPSTSIGLMLPPSLSSLSSLKILDLSFCNLCDESLPNDINGLSSLWQLYLRGNNFVNLPTGFICNLANLGLVHLDHCPRLQELPQLPSKLSQMYASDCPSMKPISVSQLWEFVERIEDKVILIPNSPLWLNVPGSEVPSWFHNQNYFCEEGVLSELDMPNVSFITDIPDHCHSSKWWGIAVCLALEGDLASPPLDYFMPPSILWSFRDPMDDLPHAFVGYLISEQYHCHHQLMFLFFPFAHEKKLKMTFKVSNGVKRGKGCSTSNFEMGKCRWEVVCEEGELKMIFKDSNEIKEGKGHSTSNIEIRKCGWRVVCKEDVETWRKTKGEGCSTSNIDMTIDSNT